MLEADGLEAYDAMIAAVQAQFPGLVMRRTSAVDAHRDLVRFNWALGAPGADPTFAGLDVAKFDADGKLHRIIGFAGETIPACRAPPPQLHGAGRGSAVTTVGAMLRDWREDRRRSQMDLALDVGVSTRHLSFVETGKSKPSPELVLALAEHLDVPLRERNTMLLAAGYAPRYQQTPLDDEAMASVRKALSELIRAHDPYPAVVVDRRWDVVMANTGAQALPRGGRRAPPRAAARTSYRITLHPDGMAPRIENLAEWAHHLLGTLDRQVA